jgi:transposase
MPFVGLDVHKRVVEAAVLDDQGVVVHRARFDCTREQLIAFAKARLGPEYEVVLEATTNTWSVVDVLRPFVKEVVVSNPLRTRAIADAKIKTDRIDALVLAQLLRSGFLPRVWQPDEQTQLKRRQTSRRASLVSDRTRIKNRIHAILHHRLIDSTKDLFGTKGRAWLLKLELDEAGRVALESELALLAAVEMEIEDMERTFAKDAYDDPRVRLLMTIPGVNMLVAVTLLAALGDISRFKTADRTASYLGIVPSTRQSADKCYHGPITKQGRGHARWMLVQAAQHFATNPGPLGVFFRRLAKKKNRNVAVVATARKLVTIAWHMLKNNEPYRYAEPRTTQSKLSRLRVRATNTKRRRGGIPKGSKRPASYGTGLSATRPIPSIDDVYKSEGIPDPKALTPGEKKMLRKNSLSAFKRSLHTARREPRKKTVEKE